jgi:hypothetical protein
MTNLKLSKTSLVVILAVGFGAWFSATSSLKAQQTKTVNKHIQKIELAINN